MSEFTYVYILANGYERLYVGVTRRFLARIKEHKLKVHPDCFTARYNITQLVYFERYVWTTAAIAREKN